MKWMSTCEFRRTPSELNKSPKLFWMNISRGRKVWRLPCRFGISFAQTKAVSARSLSYKNCTDASSWRNMLPGCLRWDLTSVWNFLQREVAARPATMLVSIPTLWLIWMSRLWLLSWTALNRSHDKINLNWRTSKSTCSNCATYPIVQKSTSPS